MHLNNNPPRPHFFRSSRNVRPIWLTALLLMTACANAVLDEEPTDEDMLGDGDGDVMGDGDGDAATGGDDAGGSGGVVTASGGSDTGGGAAVGGSLLGSGGGDGDGDGDGGSASGGAASGGAASGGAASGGAASGGAASGGAASGGAASGGSSGSCGSATVGSKATAKCGDILSFGGMLYECISQASGVNGEPTGCGTPGVYCSTIDPDNASWGDTAWELCD